MRHRFRSPAAVSRESAPLCLATLNSFVTSVAYLNNEIRT